MEQVKTDIIIIGAGPVGLFAVFEAGLLKMRCHLVDALPQPGGQLSEIYPKKPIYDIPGYPSILAGELVNNLMKQIEPFNPSFTLGERVESIEKTSEKEYMATTNRGTRISAPVIIIAGGLGSFEPRKPPLDNLAEFEDRGVEYIVKDPQKFKDKRLVIAGGGDSALDWSIELSGLASELTLVHRRDSFRGALDSVEKVRALASEGKINLITKAQATGLIGNGRLEGVEISTNDGESLEIAADFFIPLFGLTPRLGPIANWGLEIKKNAIVVDTEDYSTNIDGIYAIGDINTYPGKLKLILCGFHEGTLAVQSAFKYIYPDQKLSFKYTTVTGIKGIDE
ncbi:MAG: NAD(P)/FAD-dependent oxidoreductase [Saprospiraceae bacterium]|nr:NAD(P)/FAD-dependent oxidoreductase [Saprospiraceae bacterium]